jgi:hypothetical protein
VQALNPENVKVWFELVKTWCIDSDIPPELIFGMDESGFQPGGSKKTKVVGGRGKKHQYMVGNGDKETTTVIATICADGTALQPTIIFKGKQLQKAWLDNNVADAS